MGAADRAAAATLWSGRRGARGVVRSVFGHNDVSRRSFTGMLGGGSFAAVLASVFPMDQAKAAILDTLGPPEKTDLNIGFVPITCVTPIIMARPMGFHERCGLNAQVMRTAGWAEARDKSLAGENDATHMLTPMPLAMTLGAGASAEPDIMSAVENINRPAILLSHEHLDERDPAQWKGFTFGVPFEYSMHYFLLRCYLAAFGLDRKFRWPQGPRLQDHSGLTWEGIAETIGMSPVWTHSACMGMNAFPADKAATLVTALALPQEAAGVFAEPPTKIWEQSVPTDPCIYRFYEIVGV